MSSTKTLYFALDRNTRSYQNITVYTKKCDGDDNDEDTPYDAHSFTFKNIQNNQIYVCEILDEGDQYTDTFKLYSPECSDDEEDTEHTDIIENNSIKVISGAIVADGKDGDNAEDEDEEEEDYCHPIGNIICQLEFNENFKEYFHTNFDKLVLKIQSQIYNNGLFRIELTPEEEESLQDIIGLPNKVINHMQENCGTYFMIVFDIPDVDIPDVDIPDIDVPDIDNSNEEDCSYEEDTFILRKALLYPIH